MILTVKLNAYANRHITASAVRLGVRIIPEWKPQVALLLTIPMQAFAVDFTRICLV